MNKKLLIEEIKEEIKNLERLKNELDILLKTIKNTPSFIEIRTAGSILHDFYSLIEKVFKKIALAIDGYLPKGDTWHIELLNQMSKPFKDKRKAVISEKFLENLKKYMKFRHLFRHIYGFELKWDRIKPLIDDFEDNLKIFKEEIYKFLKDDEN